jgi:hypothetical protein
LKIKIIPKEKTVEKVVVGLFDHLSDAKEAVAELVNRGFEREKISLVASNAAGEYDSYFKDGSYDASYIEVDDDDLTRAEGAAAGAGIGATIGGLGGLLMGLGLLAVPGVGPALAVGPIAAALVGAGIGGASGGVMGALVNDGVSEEHASFYAEGIRRGGSLVSVKTQGDQEHNLAQQIMDSNGPVSINERMSAWQNTGWTAFDPKASPYTAQQIMDERKLY